jgi:hypothetical protein
MSHSTAVSIDAKDKVTVYGWKALAGSVVGYSMDGFSMDDPGICRVHGPLRICQEL